MIVVSLEEEQILVKSPLEQVENCRRKEICWSMCWALVDRIFIFWSWLLCSRFKICSAAFAYLSVN
jgi:hypothetical protein